LAASQARFQQIKELVFVQAAKTTAKSANPIAKLGCHSTWFYTRFLSAHRFDYHRKIIGYKGRHFLFTAY